MSPQGLSRVLFLGGIAVFAMGCSGRFQRPKYYDPFASARQTPGGTERAANEYPQLVPPGPATEVTQAGREFNPRRPAADRSHRTRTDSELTQGRSEESNWDAAEAEVPARPSARPAAGLDHAPDYSWIQGKLEYSALSGGIWRVRYAPLSADDQHGGSMILQSSPDTQQFRVGDVVYVEGRIVEQNTHGPLPNPIYRVERMSRASE